MRLIGRKAIMEHLSKSVVSNSSWRRVRVRYARAIRRDRETGRVWSDTTWLDAIDVGESAPVCKVCQGPYMAPLLPPSGGPHFPDSSGNRV